MNKICIDDDIVLNNGSTVKNRFFKSAMSEQLGNKRHQPTKKLVSLYDAWARGGAGILVTGNVMIDPKAISEPKNVVLDDKSDLDRFRQWAKAGQANGAKIWMQLNHPGKQIPAYLNQGRPVAPSAVPMNEDFKHFISTPRALTEEEIWDIIGKFATSAKLAKEAGFDGVQIHGAHGYLVSQFLSPRHNVRADQWGGSPENRMRFVREVYAAIRAQVGADFSISIKLNSADFMKDGLSEAESMKVIEALDKDGINLVEISGGTYESPSMLNPDAKQSTLKREAFFIEFAEQAKRFTQNTLLVVTGGFRSVSAMNDALRSGATDMIGIARPMAIYPDLPSTMLNNRQYKVTIKYPSTGIHRLDIASAIGISWYEEQIHRIADGKPANPDLNVWLAALSTLRKSGVAALRKRRA